MVVCTPYNKVEEAGRIFGHGCLWEIVVDQTDQENVPISSNGVTIVTSSLPVDHTVLLALNHTNDGKDVGLMFTDGHSLLVQAGIASHFGEGVEEVVTDMAEIPYPEVFSYICNGDSSVWYG